MLWYSIGALGAAIALASFLIKPDMTGSDVLITKTTRLDVIPVLCYKRIADFLSYPKWMVSIVDAGSDTIPDQTKSGYQFQTTSSKGWFGNTIQTNVIAEAQFARRFSFTTDNFARTLTEFNVSATNTGGCKIVMEIRTKRSNLFFRIFLCPFLRFVYNNWATQSLITFKINN